MLAELQCCLHVNEAFIVKHFALSLVSKIIITGPVWHSFKLTCNTAIPKQKTISIGRRSLQAISDRDRRQRNVIGGHPQSQEGPVRQHLKGCFF